MNEERLLGLIVAPHISEKSTRAAEERREFVFRVICDATKSDVGKAVELLFDVRVKKVRTLNVKGKSKVFGRIHGRRKDWKKAYVTIGEGQDIDFAGSR